MYVRAAIIALAGAAAFGLGYRVAAGSYEARIADIAVAVSESQDAAARRASEALAAESRRADAAEKARAAERGLAAGVMHEIAAAADLSCEFRDSHRLRLERLYGAYGYGPDGASARVPGDVLGPAQPGDAARDVGRGDRELGSGLRGSAP